MMTNLKGGGALPLLLSTEVEMILAGVPLVSTVASFVEMDQKRGGAICRNYWLRINPHGHVSLKMQNIQLVFDVCVLGDFKRRKLDGRMDLMSNPNMDLTSKKLGRFSFLVRFALKRLRVVGLIRCRSES